MEAVLFGLAVVNTVTANGVKQSSATTVAKTAWSIASRALAIAQISIHLYAIKKAPYSAFFLSL